MYILVLLTSALCSKKVDRYFIKPSDSDHEALKMYPNFSLRVINELKDITMTFESMAVEVDKIQEQFVALKLNNRFICKSSDINTVVTSFSFSESDCIWKIEPQDKKTVMLKIGGSYLAKTDEADNRLSSEGYKLRLLPLNTRLNKKWTLTKANHHSKKKLEHEESSSSSSDSNEKEPKKDKEENKKKSVVIGVSKSFTPSQKEKLPRIKQ